MRIDGHSNVCLMTIEDVLHIVVPHAGEVTDTGEIKAKATTYVDLIFLLVMGSMTFQVTMTRCCVTFTNLYHTFSLAPFRRAGRKKTVHYMNNKVQITLDDVEVVEIPISVALNHLDYSKFKILSQG